MTDGGWKSGAGGGRQGRRLRLDGMCIEDGSDYHVKNLGSIEPPVGGRTFVK
jgi:hypothetical protein